MAGKTKTKTKTKPSVNRLYLSQGSSQGFATLTEQARPPYRAILEELLYRKKKPNNILSGGAHTTKIDTISLGTET